MYLPIHSLADPNADSVTHARMLVVHSSNHLSTSYGTQIMFSAASLLWLHYCSGGAHTSHSFSTEVIFA